MSVGTKRDAHAVRDSALHEATVRAIAVGHFERDTVALERRHQPFLVPLLPELLGRQIAQRVREQCGVRENVDRHCIGKRVDGVDVMRHICSRRKARRHLFLEHAHQCAIVERYGVQ